MISHKFKCIFIHIPRTGGSSIEKMLVGRNWWGVDKRTKHLTASQAKSIYRPFWDDYFKFSFVRNPYDRAASLLSFPKIYYGSGESEMLTCSHVDWYKEIFGAPYTLEYDYRFWGRDEVLRDIHRANQVYGNILDEELDFVGRFEILHDDMNYVLETIGFGRSDIIHEAASKIQKNDKLEFYQDSIVKNMVRELYYKDFLRFGYQMDWKKR